MEAKKDACRRRRGEPNHPVSRSGWRKIVMTRIEKFDRVIRRRDIRETVAALVVAAFFTYTAWRQTNALELAGSVIIVAIALWTMYYIWRHGTEPSDPNPDQTPAGYQHALARK
ncbi:MAG: hypothetical protein DMG58_21860 [Acidobacteria bacterium]|nr:MAG: hypothetical protein DMG58_21860 [Acidobacteriota bacterium]